MPHVGVHAELPQDMTLAAAARTECANTKVIARHCNAIHEGRGALGYLLWLITSFKQGSVFV